MSGDLLRPWLRGDRTNLKVGNTHGSLPFTEYSGRAYGNDYGSVNPIRPSGIETLLNTFLGLLMQITVFHLIHQSVISRT